MSPDRCDVTRPWRSMRGVPFGCRMIARNWYRVLKASIANTFPEKSSSLRGSRTTISERLIPIGRRKGCSTQVPFDRGRALGVLWLSRVTRLHREFRFRSDTKGFELSDEHKRTSTNESLLYHIPRQYPPWEGTARQSLRVRGSDRRSRVNVAWVWHRGEDTATVSRGPAHGFPDAGRCFQRSSSSLR